MADKKFWEITAPLRANVAGLKAVVLIGPDGVTLEHLAVDPNFDIDGFASEYAMLLRIARRTSEDTGSGELSEHIAISQRTITIARSIATDSYLVLVSGRQDQIGRARYELKVAARQLERKLRAGDTVRIQP